MRLLFEIDSKDYNINGIGSIRHSARCITIKNGKIAMIYSSKYKFYKFPGGGIEKSETPQKAMMRETLEEAGLIVIPESIREFGYVHRIQKSAYENEDYFLQDNFYYVCEVKEYVVEQNLCEYETDEGYTLTWVKPETAINANNDLIVGSKNRDMLIRENGVLKLLIEEGYFG